MLLMHLKTPKICLKLFEFVRLVIYHVKIFQFPSLTAHRKSLSQNIMTFADEHRWEIKRFGLLPNKWEHQTLRSATYLSNLHTSHDQIVMDLAQTFICKSACDIICRLFLPETAAGELVWLIPNSILMLNVYLGEEDPFFRILPQKPTPISCET